jgi:hypothetical protein
MGMIQEQVNKRTASRRRTYPRPTLYAQGITRRDRLFLWWLAYRLPVRNLPFEADLTFEVLEEACRKCRYPQWRLWEIRYNYPKAWERMLVKRAHRLCGTKDPQSTDGRWSGALKTDAMCRHPRIARIIGWPYCGSFRTPLRAGEALCDVHARDAELSHEAQKEADRGEIAQQAEPLEQPMPEWPSMPEWRPIPECARPLPPAARSACEHPQDDSGRYGFGGVHSVW